MRHDIARACPIVARTAANASTTAPQRGAKSFHIRTCRRGVETRFCAKLRMPIGTVRPLADTASRVCSEPAVMSPTRRQNKNGHPKVAVKL